VNEAHAVLSDPESRAKYDASCVDVETAKAPNRPVDPVTCSCCGAVSAQPRYIIFWYVVGLLLFTMKRTIQGVYCPSRAPKKALQASAITWLCGWWGVPWGPIWTVGAIYRNLVGGTQPADVNGQILARQALYFFEKGRPELAAAALNQALSLKLKAEIRDRLLAFKQSLPPAPQGRLVDRWKLMRTGVFWAQIAPIIAIVGLVIWNSRDGLLCPSPRGIWLMSATPGQLSWRSPT
jgi:hypothetical protein